MIVWDERKRLANLAKRQLDFASFEADFDLKGAFVEPTGDPATVRARLNLIGWLGGVRLVVVIIAPLGTQGLAIISLRPASRKERKLYDEAQG